MRIINHIIFTDIGGGEKLMINSLNGLMVKVNKSTFETLDKWRRLEDIVPSDEQETVLFENLKSHGYLVTNDAEEIAIKEKILQQLRKNHEESKANNKHIVFIITYDCNFRCPYCFEGSIVDSAVITPEQINAALDLFGGDLQSVGLFGGEPLLPKNRAALEHIIKKVPDIPYHVITNGYYLEEFFDLLSKVTIASIMITLDGEEEAHNSRRYLVGGEPTYNKIMAGIKKYLENNTPICIRMNLDESNLDGGLQLKTALLEQFSGYGDLLSFEMSPMVEASLDEKNQVMSKLYNADADFTPEEQKLRNRMLGRFSPIINTFISGEKLKPVYSFCAAHQGGYLVDPFGKIYPCLVSVGKDELAIGTYYPKVEFKENSIRNRNIDKIPECRECIYSLLCGGGCAVSLNDYADVFKPVCFNIMNQIHNFLPSIYNSKVGA